MAKGLRITLYVFLAILIMLTGFMTFWYFCDSYKVFYNRSQKEFSISGLSEGFIPQGITFNKDKNLFFTCGYMKDGSTSRVYVVDKLTNKTIKYFTIKINDKDYVGHAGGIATDKNNVWICGDDNIVCLSLLDVENVKDKQSVVAKNKLTLNHKADYCFVENNNLWIGEFENGKKYQLPKEHSYKTNSGKTNTALAFCYNIDTTKPCGFDNQNIVKALSTPRLVQGMQINGNKVCISTSYSLPNSHLTTYDNVFTAEPKQINLFNKEIPLYVLEENSIVDDIEAPAMSEEIVLVDGRIYVMFENACKKYIYFTREKLENVYSFEMIK